MAGLLAQIDRYTDGFEVRLKGRLPGTRAVGVEGLFARANMTHGLAIVGAAIGFDSHS
jgi:hypothetical protein